jgi:hypothetical protein
MHARIYALPHQEQDEYYANRKLGMWGRFSESSRHADKSMDFGMQPHKRSNAQAIATLVGMLAWNTEKIKRIEQNGQKLILDAMTSGEARAFGFEYPRRFADNAVEVVRDCMGAECSLDWDKGVLVSTSLKIIEVRFLTHVEVQNLIVQFQPASSLIDMNGTTEHASKRIVNLKQRTKRGPGRPTDGISTELAIRQLIEEGSFDLQGVVTKQIYRIRERMLLNDPSLDVTADKPSDQTIGRVVARIKEEIALKLIIPDEYLLLF